MVVTLTKKKEEEVLTCEIKIFIVTLGYKKVLSTTIPRDI